MFERRPIATHIEQLGAVTRVTEPLSAHPLHRKIRSRSIPRSRGCASRSIINPRSAALHQRPQHHALPHPSANLWSVRNQAPGFRVDETSRKSPLHLGLSKIRMLGEG